MFEKDHLTYKIIGCAMKIHNVMGPGFQEVIYQRCFEVELKKADIPFARELDHEIYYDGVNVGSRRADFVVDNRIILELKAVPKLEDVHLVQVKNYLSVFDYPLGLLINFGAKSLEQKLLFNNNYKQNSQI